MISWIVIVILLVVGIFAVKMNHLRHRIFIIFLIILALFLYTTMAVVTSKNELDLTTSEGIFSSLKIYGGWLANGFNNLKGLTGNALGMDWGSTNASFFNNSDKNVNNKKSRG